MISSFKTRLILLSVLVSGVALVGFGVGSWWLIRSIQLERLDTEVRVHAEREVGRPRTAFGWQRFEADVLTNFGLRKPEDLLLLAQDGAGQVIYQSPNWPSTFAIERLPWPSQHDVPKAGPWIQLLRLPPPDGPRGLPREGQWGPPPPTSADLPAEPNLEPPPLGVRPGSSVIFRDIAGEQWRIGLASTERAHVLIAVNAKVMDGEMTSVRNAFVVAIPFALLLISLGAWVLSSRAMRPLQKLTEATQRVTAKGLDQRLTTAGKDQEFVELIAVYNGMLERLERSFKQATRFSADAAHELKTPLAILQGQMERVIHQAEEDSPLQRELSSILDEVRRLSGISRKLLLLSQADAQVRKENFDLSAALEEVLEDSQMLAPHLKISSEIEPGLTIQADSSLLHQVLYNLISNAIKYNLEPGWIHIAAKRHGACVEVSIANASTGMTPADEARLFERFFRADTAHSRQVEGVGLGLSLSREIARAHGGELRLQSQSSEQMVFELQLPLN
ncbi:MAG: signal transduction histidine kinase [Comamonadaceae bacterium]|nr:MAG: signal transduction histidine kinase [Comamonadaceae bacterium]